MTVHRVICSGDCARSLQKGRGRGTGLPVCVPMLRRQRPLEASATLSARRPDARPQPAEGGARGVARSGAGLVRPGAGRRVLAAPDPPSAVPVPCPAPQAARQRALGGQWAPTVTSPETWLLSEAKPPGAPSGTKEKWQSKRWPGSFAAGAVREDNRTPPAPTPSCPRLSLSYLAHLAVPAFAAEGGDLRRGRDT